MIKDDIPLFPDDKVKVPKEVGGGAFSFADTVEEPPLPSRHALIDGDMLIYACCYSEAAKEGLDAVKAVWDNKVNTILIKSRSSTKDIFLTRGPCNFRYRIFPDYKADRDKPKPEFYHRMREWAVARRDATMVCNAEADDALCYNSFGNTVPDTDSDHTIICTDDKDLDMVPGWHYRLRTQECYYVEPDFGEFKIEDTPKGAKKIMCYGPLAFYYQLLLGDVTDGIPGLGVVAESTRAKYALRRTRGCGPVCAYTILQDSTDLLDASYRVAEAYKEKYGKEWYTQYLLNARVLWMQTTEGEMYEPPKETLQYWKERSERGF